MMEFLFQGTYGVCMGVWTGVGVGGWVAVSVRIMENE